MKVPGIFEVPMKVPGIFNEMKDKSEAAMKHGVANLKVLLAI